MNRKQILAFAVLLSAMLLSASAFAQSYLIYSVTGRVSMLQSGKSVKPIAGKHLSANQSVNIGKESALILIDTKKNKMFSLTRPSTGKVGEMVRNASPESKNVTSRFIAYVKKEITTSGSQKRLHPDTYLQATGSSYRSTRKDSVLLTSICNKLPITGNSTAEDLIFDEGTNIESDMDVSFELVESLSNKPIGEDVAEETCCYVMVKNNTDNLLYVNVLDVDAAGDKYLVLPVDAASLCAHLAVPAGSVVSFIEEPFIFSGSSACETFMLVASREPIDFSILMSPIASSGKKVMPLGISRKFYSITEE